MGWNYKENYNRIIKKKKLEKKSIEFNMVL